MGPVKLEVHCPKNMIGITIDPEPDWDFNSLIAELDSLQNQIATKSRRFYNERRVDSRRRGFVMRLLDDDFDDIEENEEEEEEVVVYDRRLVEAKRFNCDQLYLSDSDESYNDSALKVEPYLMDGNGLVEGALIQMTHEHQLIVKEEIRNQISALETDLISESEKSSSALLRVQKYREARRDSEKKLDTQYQRKIAEALDNHLTAIQRDHEFRSQIEERRIRSDAAHEESKRKERALEEEKIRQEKARAEAEAKIRAEEANRVSLEAERKAAKELAEREAAESSNKNASRVTQEEAGGHPRHANSGILNAQAKGSGSDGRKDSLSAGNILRAAESAIKLEQGRLQKLKEIDEENQSLRLTSVQDFSSYERHISRLVRQIRGVKENVRTKAAELIKIFNNPLCPQSVSTATFVKKVVSHCESPDNAAFAGYVIVLVTSQVPHVMDLLLAEFHKACIYTVPKHMAYIESAFQSKTAYHKTLGFRQDDGKIESVKDYLTRLESYIKQFIDADSSDQEHLFSQTEIEGIENIHGLKEGWAWLARFLNTLPVNIYTAVALKAFLQMAGFALFRKYKSQFKKMLNFISENFLQALRERENSVLNPVITEIRSYIEDGKYLEEPAGRSLQDVLLSSVMVPELEYQESY
ncbi:LOW QUALITY PROTEIN: GLE1 domain-containing protein, partial [Cephalotus follicularis]